MDPLKDFRVEDNLEVATEKEKDKQLVELQEEDLIQVNGGWGYPRDGGCGGWGHPC